MVRIWGRSLSRGLKGDELEEYDIDDLTEEQPGIVLQRQFLEHIVSGI